MKKLTIAPILHLLDFFENILGSILRFVGIGGVLSQESHPIAFFSEKLNEAIQSLQ